MTEKWTIRDGGGAEASLSSGADEGGSNATLAPPHRELADEIGRLADEIGALRAAIVRQAGNSPAPSHIERVIHDLAESLEELEADNAALHADNERLLAAQEQILVTLANSAEPIAPAAPVLFPSLRPDPPEPRGLAEENARLRERLAWTETQVAGLRAVERTRAWRLVHLYWSWARRVGRARPGSAGA